MKATALGLALLWAGAPLAVLAADPAPAPTKPSGSIKPKTRLAVAFQNINRNLGGNREGGATRGPCPANAIQLTALVPENYGGLTAAERPTLFWYVPAVNGIPLEFRMTDSIGRTVYETTFASNPKGGLVSLTLPTQIPALLAGRDYTWYMSLVCPGGDNPSYISTSGWIQRVESNPTILKATAAERPTLYAQSGIWFDTLSSLAMLRVSQPENTRLQEEWTELLTSLGLSKVVSQPLGCVATPSSPVCS